MRKETLTCAGCVFAAKASDGRDGCAQFQKIINLDNDFCSWRLAVEHDLICSKCGQHVYGKSIIYNGQVYCYNCGGQV